jgi:hypothetical protein
MAGRDLVVGVCGGLLASSCCLLQLTLNLFGIGIDNALPE